MIPWEGSQTPQVQHASQRAGRSMFWWLVIRLGILLIPLLVGLVVFGLLVWVL